VNHKFEDRGKFALLTFSAHIDLPAMPFRLSDGAWVMPGIPVTDLGIWKEWIGTIRMEQLQRANLVLFVQEASDNPDIVNDAHQRLANRLHQLFCLMHLRSGIEYESADLLCGSLEHGGPEIRQIRKIPTFYKTKGYRRAAVTKDWLEDAILHRDGMMTMETYKGEFRRTMRGLNALLNGLQQQHGQDRLHQFVRALEALILPAKGNTTHDFLHRCQTFARACSDTRTLLLEAYSMRSDTEHMHHWDEAMQDYPADQRDDVCCQRTRQIEHLTCDAYSRLLHGAALRDHFRTDDTTRAFWQMRDDQRRTLWGTPLDITQEPLVRNYNQFGRAVA
jgi:hypothetical protein